MPISKIETHTKTKTSSPEQPRPLTRPPAAHPAAIIQRARVSPESLSAADVLQLQRTIGNRAVGQLLAGIGRLPSRQAPVQRQETEEECLQCTMTEAVQRQPEPEEEPVQAQAQPNRTGMPDHLKSGLETLSGMDLSDVRVHYGSSKPAQLNALAYIRGQEIHVAPGQERHLPHEGWHAVQQMQGRVRLTMQAKSVAINDDGRLEREADVMGAKALQMTGSDQVAASSTLWTPTSLQRRKIVASSFPGHETLSGISMDDVKVHYTASSLAQLQTAAYMQGSDIYVGSALQGLFNVQPSALSGVGTVQRQIDRSLELKESGLPLELKDKIFLYNFNFGDVKPAPVVDQMQALDAIEHTIYAWYNKQDTYNFSVAKDPLLETYRLLEAETRREREKAVDRALADKSAPVDRTKLNKAEALGVDAVWADLVNGTGYLKIAGDPAFKRKIRAMLVRILDTPPGRQLLTAIATGSGRKREVIIGAKTPPEAKKAFLLEESPQESMSDPQIYSGWFNKWLNRNTSAKQLATSLTSMQPVDNPDDPKLFYQMKKPGDMMYALASKKIGVVVTGGGESKYFKFGSGAHGAYVALIESADDTDNRDVEGKAVHTPAFVTLAHELGHALNQLSGSATLDMDTLLAHFSETTVEDLGTPETPGPKRKQWTNMEEMVTILGIENAIRKAVGLKERGGHAGAIDPDIVERLSISKQATSAIIQLVSDNKLKLDKKTTDTIIMEAFELNKKPVKSISMQEKVQRIKEFRVLFDTRINNLIINSKDKAKEVWEKIKFEQNFESKFKEFFPNLSATLY